VSVTAVTDTSDHCTSPPLFNGRSMAPGSLTHLLLPYFAKQLSRLCHPNWSGYARSLATTFAAASWHTREIVTRSLQLRYIASGKAGTVVSRSWVCSRVALLSAVCCSLQQCCCCSPCMYSSVETRVLQQRICTGRFMHKPSGPALMLWTTNSNSQSVTGRHPWVATLLAAPV
jgi:hypothetical protein